MIGKKIPQIIYLKKKVTIEIENNYT